MASPIIPKDGAENAAQSDAQTFNTMVIDPGEARANVVSEHQCAGFCGSAASFFEQGQNLVRALK